MTNDHSPAKVRAPQRPVTLITGKTPVLTKDKVREIWRDEERETKRSQHFKGNKLLRQQIKDRLKHGDNIPHRQQWVGKLPDFPIYGDREGSFQADCMFMPPTNQYVGCLCLISVNRKIAWAEPFLGGISEEGGPRTKRITARAMAPYLLKCVREIEQWFGEKVRQIESDYESMFHGELKQILSEKCIPLYLVAPSVSGPLKTKVGVVERFNRTLKSILKKMIDEYGLDEKAWKDLLPEALYQYNYENTQRAVGKTPAEVTDRDEELFASHKYAETVHTQRWWDAEVNGQTQGLRPNDENQKDHFKKEMRRFHPRPVYTFTSNPAGPSLRFTANNTGLLQKRRLLPHNVSWK